jgi:biopolymer transport protein ExbD
MKGNAQGTMRYLLMKKNEAAIKLINKEKEKWQKGEINDSVYQERAKEIRNREDLERPIVMIKPTGRASYSDVVAVLDEMQINNISRFQIETLSKEDSTALEKLGVKLPPAPAQ